METFYFTDRVYKYLLNEDLHFFYTCVSSHHICLSTLNWYREVMNQNVKVSMSYMFSRHNTCTGERKEETVLDGHHTDYAHMIHHRDLNHTLHAVFFHIQGWERCNTLCSLGTMHLFCFSTQVILQKIVSLTRMHIHI